VSRKKGKGRNEDGEDIVLGLLTHQNSLVEEAEEERTM